MYYFYITCHSISLGTIPNKLLFMELESVNFKTIFCCNRELTNDELKYYDIHKYCPNCHKSFNGYPAISRDDNKTHICPSCGVMQAWECYKELNV